VSVSAISHRTSSDPSNCAARLIPGCGSLKRELREGHQLVRPAPSRRVAQSEEGHAAHCELAPATPSFVLPSAVQTNELWELAPLVLVDLCLVLFSWVTVALAVLFAGTSEARLFSGWPKLYLPELGMAFVFAVLVILLSHSERLYQNGVDHQYEPVLLTKIMVWSTLVVEVAIRLGGFPISFRQLVLSALLSFGALVAMRGWRGHAGRTVRSRKRIRNVLIVGAGASGREIAAYIERHPELDRVLCGFLDDSGPGCPGVLGPPEKLAAIARAKFIDEVIFATPHRPDLAQFVIRESRRNHLDVKVVPYFYGCEFQQPRLENLGAISLITLHTEKAPAAALFAKRILDFVLSTLGLLLTSPLLLMIAAVVRLDSKGPAIYAASRVGRKGQRFLCYKFRTMIGNAAESKDLLRSRNEREGPCFKIANDPRVTRVGHWLRRYSLDELPQLWNVWKGEMSLVGPRPHPVDDFSRYHLAHFRRLDVVPGMTGLWQVTARQDPSFETTMALDLEYIEQWSLRMDLKILFETIGTVARGTGS